MCHKWAEPGYEAVRVNLWVTCEPWLWMTLGFWYTIAMDWMCAIEAIVCFLMLPRTDRKGGQV